VVRLEGAEFERIDEAPVRWRQGDCVLGKQWLLFRTNRQHPLTSAGQRAAAEGSDSAEAQVCGLMVLTQTCDIVRSCKSQKFIEVSPLVRVDSAVHRQARRGHRPRLAFIAGPDDRRLVADLDRVMTVEKAVVAGWNLVRGGRTEDDARRLSQALARKRARMAFLDDFIEAARPLVRRIASKHDRQSPEGRALRGLREIRVRSMPSWDAQSVEVFFWFIREDEEALLDQSQWTGWLDLGCSASKRQGASRESMAQ